MSKNASILIAIALILIFTALLNPHSLSQLPWDRSLGFSKNITPYLVVLVVSFACYSTIGTVYTALGIEDKSTHTKKSIGTVLNIEYSGIRAGNSPRFKVTAKYEDITKTFDALDESVQFNLSIGSNIIIYFNPDNKHDSHVNLKETYELNSRPESNVSNNAVFKVIDIQPKFSEEKDLYEIIGEVSIGEDEPKKASLREVIDSSIIGSVVPGRIIPCSIEGSGNNLTISMSIKQING